MKTIYKYPVFPATPFTVKLPKGAKFLSVQVQGADPNMWFEIDTDAETELRQFMVFGTGHPMPADPLRYLGTFQLEGGGLVFHMFETLEAP